VLVTENYAEQSLGFIIQVEVSDGSPTEILLVKFDTSPLIHLYRTDQTLSGVCVTMTCQRLKHC
jgi:hypothetical protein